MAMDRNAVMGDPRVPSCCTIVDSAVHPQLYATQTP
jgi:hypothetical protein